MDPKIYICSWNLLAWLRHTTDPHQHRHRLLFSCGREKLICMCVGCSHILQLGKRYIEVHV